MRVFAIAGEPSGDALGQAVLAGLRTLAPPLQVFGVGGPLMAREGLTSLFPMSDLSVMGLAEILPRYFDIKRRIEQTAQAVVATRPDILLTIDSPDFCLRVARRVRQITRVRTVHYVAPSVWAWRPGRAARMTGTVDQVLALLPFEPPYMEAAGIPCDFVGHPVVAAPRATAGEAARFRQSFDIGDAPLVLALPGSRRSEVMRLAPVFRESLARLLGKRPGTRIVLPAAEAVAGIVEQLTADWPGAPILLAPATTAATAAAKRAAFAAADVALAASGTVSLELAAAATPMVIAYDMNFFSRQIIPRMLRIDTVTLVNLVSDTRAVPEFIGRNCKPRLIARALREVLDDPVAQGEAMAVTMQRLGQGGDPPGLRAARAVLDRM